MSTAHRTRRQADLVKGQYLLPADLVRKVRVEAAERGVWPAHVVAECLAQRFGREHVQKP